VKEPTTTPPAPLQPWEMDSIRRLIETGQPLPPPKGSNGAQKRILKLHQLLSPCKDAQARQMKFPEAAKEAGFPADVTECMMGRSAEDIKTAPARQKKTEWTSDELIQAEFPPLEFLVQDIIIVGGITLVTAKPKVGKTWKGLQIGFAVASGRKVFGANGKNVKQGKVIYYALEDNTRRLSNRLKAMKVPVGMPIIFKQTITPLDKGGIDELREVIEKEKPVLIVIDTFAPAHSNDIDENKAEDIIRIFLPLRQLSDETKVSFLVNHHHKKGALGDPREDARGSSAISANVDIVAGIYKEHCGRILRIFGNDVEDAELQIGFNEEVPYGWHIIGDAKDLEKSEIRKELIATIRDMEKNGIDPTTANLAQEVGRNRSRVQRLLNELCTGQADAKIYRKTVPGKRSGYTYHAS